jgi:hypothetical protein
MQRCNRRQHPHGCDGSRHLTKAEIILLRARKSGSIVSDTITKKFWGEDKMMVNSRNLSGFRSRPIMAQERFEVRSGLARMFNGIDHVPNCLGRAPYDPCLIVTNRGFQGLSTRKNSQMALSTSADIPAKRVRAKLTRLIHYNQNMWKGASEWLNRGASFASSKRPVARTFRCVR